MNEKRGQPLTLATKQKMRGQKNKVWERPLLYQFLSNPLRAGS
jgi:hypothetical protein